MHSSPYRSAFLILLLLLGIGAGQAAPPVNDNYISRTVLTGIDATANGTTVEATAAVGDLDYEGRAGTGPSVWYSWTAPAGINVARVTVNFATDPGECMVSRSSSSSLPVAGMAQYLPAVQESGHRSFLFRTVPGADYRVKVAGRNGSTSGTAFSLTINGLTSLPAPANDLRGAATALPPQPSIAVTGTFQNSTTDADEFFYSGTYADPFMVQPAAVWYRWTAPATGYYCHQVIGQKYLRSAVFRITGADDRMPVVETDRSPNGFLVIASNEYYIKVSSDVGGNFFSGNFQLILAPEVRNNFITRATGPPVTDLSELRDYQLAGASANPGDPAYAPGVTNVWCLLIPWPANNILTPGLWEVGGYDPAVLRVTIFRANNPGYSVVATSDRSPQMRFTVPTTAQPAAYFAEVALANPENATSPAALQGRLTLNAVPAASAPANDLFANATVLNSQPLTYIRGTTVGASGQASEDFSEAGEVVNYDVPHRTVWYRWTPLASANHYFVALDEENKPLHLRLTTGALGSLSNLGSDAVLRETGVEVSNTQTYNICVDDSDGSATGTFRLFIGRTLSFDNFANRQMITANAAGIAEWRYGSSLGMTREAGEPNLSNLGHTAWFEYRADSAVPLYINTFGSNYDTVVHVYTGNTLANLTLVANNDDFASATNRNSALSFTPTAGTFYQIRVAGYIDARGIFSLRVGRQPPAWAPYQIWAMNFDWTAPESQPLADPDKDGLSNLQECVFGGNPLVPERRRTVGQSYPPQLITQPGFGLSYRVSTPWLAGQGIGAPIAVTPEASGNLSGWLPQTPSVSGGVTTVTALPGGASGKIFLRAKVVIP